MQLTPRVDYPELLEVLTSLYVASLGEFSNRRWPQPIHSKPPATGFHRKTRHE